MKTIFNNGKRFLITLIPLLGILLCAGIANAEITFTSHQQGDVLMAGKWYRFAWTGVSGADKYVITHSFNTLNGQPITEVQNEDRDNPPSTELWVKMACPPEDVLIPQVVTITVRAERYSWFYNEWQKMEGTDSKPLELLILPSNPPLGPVIVADCSSYGGEICFPAKRFVGTNTINHEAVYANEDRAITWYESLTEAGKGAAGQAATILGTGRCYTPSPAITGVKLYYCTVKSADCPSVIPSAAVVTVVAFPALSLELNEYGNNVVLADDSNLPPNQQCTAPGTFFPLSTSPTTVIGDYIQDYKDPKISWRCADATAEEDYISEDLYTGQLEVCYSDIYPKEYRDYVCSATVTFMYYDPETKTTATKECSAESTIRIFRFTGPDISCDKVMACEDKETVLNPNEPSVPAFDYDWSPKEGLSAYNIPNPTVVWNDLPGYKTKYIMRRKPKTNQVYPVDPGAYYCVYVTKGSNNSICGYDPIVCGTCTLSAVVPEDILNKSESSSILYDYKWVPAEGLDNPYTTNPTVTYEDLPADDGESVVYMMYKKLKTDTHFPEAYATCEEVFKSSVSGRPSDSNNQNGNKSIEPGNASFESLNTVKLNVYPNPASDNLNVEYSGGRLTNAEFLVQNVFGQTIIRKSLINDSARTELHIGNLPNGTYLCTLLVKGVKNSNKTFIVNH